MSLTLFHTVITPKKLAFDDGNMMDNDGLLYHQRH